MHGSKTWRTLSYRQARNQRAITAYPPIPPGPGRSDEPQHLLPNVLPDRSPQGFRALARQG